MDQPLPATEITALLGRGTRFEGKLYFEGRVRIDGTFAGEIKSDDTLIIGDGAEVNAEIDVSTVIVRGGSVHGNIRAKTSLEVHAPAKVIGNIHSPSLFIERGVEFQGSCRMDAVEGESAQSAARSTPEERLDGESARTARLAASTTATEKTEKAEKASRDGSKVPPVPQPRA